MKMRLIYAITCCVLLAVIVVAGVKIQNQQETITKLYDFAAYLSAEKEVQSMNMAQLETAIDNIQRQHEDEITRLGDAFWEWYKAQPPKIETITEIKEVVKEAPIVLADPESLDKFVAVLEGSMQGMFRDFPEGTIPDCDDYVQHTQRYAVSKGILLSWDSIETSRYLKIFGKSRIFEGGEHAVIQATIQDVIYYADYFIKTYHEDGTISFPGGWLIKEYLPVD